ARSGRRLVALPYTNEVTYSSFSGDGRFVITASMERNLVSEMQNDIFLWEVPSGRRLNSITAGTSHRYKLLYAAFSPDGGRLLTCGFDFCARLWDAHTGQ